MPCYPAASVRNTAALVTFATRWRISMRVLMITLELPTEERPGTWAPVARQLESLRALGVEMDVVEVKGPGKLKYAEAVPRMTARIAHADVVHAHWGYCGWVGRCQVRRPLVVSFMGSDLVGP